MAPDAPWIVPAPVPMKVLGPPPPMKLRPMHHLRRRAGHDATGPGEATLLSRNRRGNILITAPRAPGGTFRAFASAVRQQSHTRSATPRRRRGASAPAPSRASHTRIGISTYSASGFALSMTMVGAEPSAKRNTTFSAIWSVMSFR